MAVAEGRNGKVSVCYYTSLATTGSRTVAELGNWTVSGISRNMIDYTAFGDTVMKFKPGMLDPGSLSFSGHFDGSDEKGQEILTLMMSSGTAITNRTSAGSTATTKRLGKLRLWANDDANFDSYGYWSCTGSQGEIYITGMELSQDKNGLGTVSFTGKASKGALKWSTTT
jgi:hypothetical protein